MSTPTTDVICYRAASVCEVPEDDTDVSKHVAVVQDHTLKRVFSLCIVLVS
jgi:hypothetical protein